ncbi:MAG: radical SAM protein [Candidatus Eremiobacteraeota bacterium]|nr:radical SAM protein [Candidatus Eremiobacteraeota bacterium]
MTTPIAAASVNESIKLGHNDAIKFGPSCLTILPTYRCTAACENCCFGSHPWVQGRIPQADILRYIDEAAALETIDNVVFSGGECFLLGDDLYEAIGRASSLGLGTRCVTNGYWAASLPAAQRILKKCRDAGLSEINFSTGDEHAKFVPIENILHGSRAAQEVAIGVWLMVELSGKRKVSKSTLVEHPLAIQYFGDGGIADIINESPWISMDEGVDPVVPHGEYLLNRDNVSQRSGCNSILSTLVVTPQKNLKACCGITSEQIPEVRLGNLDDARMHDMYRDAEQDFLKLWLAVEGPEKILAWSAEHDPTIEWENRFAHQCDACRFMYKDEKVQRVIEEHYQERLHDVLLRYSLTGPGR